MISFAGQWTRLKQVRTHQVGCRAKHLMVLMHDHRADPLCNPSLPVYWSHGAGRQGPSWSSINYDGTWKLLHHRAVQFFSPVLVSATVNRADGTITVFITSDVPAAIQGEASARFIT